MTEAYPLQWPPGWQRTETDDRQRSNFYGSMTQQVYKLHNELRLLGAVDVVISTNQPVRTDGQPYSTTRIMDDPGAAAYFSLNDNQQCIPCDKWDLLKDNLRAIVKTIEALRGIERWGAKEMVDAAFRGFIALPSPDDVIAVGAYPQYFKDCIDLINGKEKYKELVKKFHPDSGGKQEEFVEMQKQWSIFKTLKEE